MRRILLTAVAVGVMAAAVVSYVGSARRTAKRFSLPPEVTPQVEEYLRLQRQRPGPRLIDTHPLEQLKGSPFPPDGWAR